MGAVIEASGKNERVKKNIPDPVRCDGRVNTGTGCGSVTTQQVVGIITGMGV
jgi:hypothetical protein